MIYCIENLKIISSFLEIMNWVMCWEMSGGVERMVGAAGEGMRRWSYVGWGW